MLQTFLIDIVVKEQAVQLHVDVVYKMSRDGLRGFRPGPTQIGLYIYIRRLED